jgi:Kef-type K+ transport system membrane component KefB
MGALVAGVSLSISYALDVTVKVTEFRDFFITLFFVALGMMISVPSGAIVWLAIVLVLLTLVSRLITVFPTLYAMKQGIRASLLPAVNLGQISEFSLVLIQVGVQSGQTTPEIASAASFGFIILAVLSTFMITRARCSYALPLLASNAPVCATSTTNMPRPERTARSEAPHIATGFHRAASSFLSELEHDACTARSSMCRRFQRLSSTS